MPTARKPLPTAARVAVRESLEAAQDAARLIRQIRRAQTATAPGDRDLADALSYLEQLQRLLGETLGGRMESSHQMPSVGRQVHYKAYGTPGAEFPAGVCRAAIITEVDEPSNPASPIGICVLNPTGIVFNQHIRFGDAPGQWHWPELVPPAD